MYTLPFKFDLGDRIHISLPYMNFFIMYCSPDFWSIVICITVISDELGCLKQNKYKFKT